MQEWDVRRGLTPKTKLMIVIPVIAVLVLVLVYFQLFSSPVLIALIFAAYVIVSLLNRRKFKSQRESGSPPVSGRMADLRSGYLKGD